MRGSRPTSIPSSLQYIREISFGRSRVEEVMTPADEEWIHEIIGRKLDSSECATFETMESISGAVASIARSLAAKYRVLACKYLKERVPSAGYDEVKEKIAALDRARS